MCASVLSVVNSLGPKKYSKLIVKPENVTWSLNLKWFLTKKY